MLTTKGKLLPNFTDAISEFEEMITWRQMGNTKVPEPKLGLDAEYDEVN
jgi:hypothetical protein